MSIVVLGFNFKRGRKEKTGDYRNTKLYGQTFPYRRKIVCSPRFIEESGLSDESIRNAAISAIGTDYGIKLEVRPTSPQALPDGIVTPPPSDLGELPPREPDEKPPPKEIDQIEGEE